MNHDEFMATALRLIAEELVAKRHMSTQVLFGDELAADDWTPEDAVDALFRYASQHGWGE